MKARKQAFSKEFLAKFADEHKKLTGEDVTKTVGYPDMGNGYYGRQLSYAHWLELAKAQRAHYNYLEVIASNLVLLLTASILIPRCACYCGISFLVGRILYSTFYKTSKGSGHPLR